MDRRGYFDLTAIIRDILVPLSPLLDLLWLAVP